MHNLEKERWLFAEVVDHNKIYESNAAEGFSAFNIGLVILKRKTLLVDIPPPGEWHTLHLSRSDADYPTEVDGSFLTIPILGKW